MAHRRAIIIGINQYADADIPNLDGAVNDAREIRHYLAERGDFEVLDDHFLLDSRATYLSIRKAISDLLWNSDPCEMALIYFSGHGFRDKHHKTGYLAPHDMKKNEPFVSGLDVLELKKAVLGARNKQSIFMVIDSCHSGISAKGDKDIGGEEALFDEYFDDIKKIPEGEGKFILASSEEGKVARERSFKHGDSEELHTHGLFSFHFIEGLSGKAADSAGIVTLSKLREYVDRQLGKVGHQKPMFFSADSSRPDQIRIATSSMEFEKFLQDRLDQAEQYLSEYQFSAITLMRAAECVVEALARDPSNKRGRSLENDINRILGEYRTSVSGWLLDNEYDLYNKVKFVYPDLKKLCEHLACDKIVKLDNRKKGLLSNLYAISTNKIALEIFIDFCRPFNVPPKPAIKPLKPPSGFKVSETVNSPSGFKVSETGIV